MTITDIQNFFYMGGYAVYIWPAYVITAVILLSSFFYSFVLKKKILKQLNDQNETAA